VVFLSAGEWSLICGVHEASLPECVVGVAHGFTPGRL
jgi:hypothetical protein